MTRKTLYFHLLAWLALAQGHAELYYWLLPKKSKQRWAWGRNEYKIAFAKALADWMWEVALLEGWGGVRARYAR